jgi:uncharacterized glyoxalase superfamily metalloenzyme YdcJ
MHTFIWKPSVTASKEAYEILNSEHSILADVACFRTAHINHLTPRTLDTSKAQDAMRVAGMMVKDRLEGPPSRRCPILLQQTSFLALEERMIFPRSNAKPTSGFHKARFGEIEERGAAATAEGRKLYDDLLDEAIRKWSESPGAESSDYGHVLSETFRQYPDSWEELSRRRLAYFTFRPTEDARIRDFSNNITRDELVDKGLLSFHPITYEDFLPLSAAGIFQSNLRGGITSHCSAKWMSAMPNKINFEAALGREILDQHDIYGQMQRASLVACATAMSITMSL